MRLSILKDKARKRAKMPPDVEIALWASEKRKAEAEYLAAIRFCDERIMSAYGRAGETVDSN